MRYYLVQRLRINTHPSPSAVGLDRYFGCDYMGSSEFEWGAVPNALKEIRAAGELVIESREILRPNNMHREVFFVAPREGLDRKIDDFQTWVADEMPRGKEASYFPEAFEGTARWGQEEIVAWWSLKDQIAWALHRSVAENLVRAFEPTGNKTGRKAKQARKAAR